MGEGREQVRGATTEELRLENLEPLFAALDDPYVPIRCSAMRALARLPLGQDASARFIAWVLDRLARLDQASTSDVLEIPPAEMIAAAGSIDAPGVRERLRGIVRDGTEAQRREAAHALANEGDEGAIGQLVQDLSVTDPALRRRAAQDLLQLGAPGNLDLIRQAAAADPDSQVRATLSMVIAREGDPGPMVQLLDEFKARPDDSLPILLGVQTEVARRGPLPLPARTAIVRAVAGLGDVEAPPLVFLVRRIGVAEPIEPQAGPTPSQWKPIGRHEGASLSKDLAEIVAGQDGDRLHALDAGAVGELVNVLLQDAMDDPSYIGANDVVNLVRVRPDYAPDIPRIFRAYQLVTAPAYAGPPVVPMQLAWALSRAGLQRVVEGLAEPLGSPDPRERLAAADLIELTAIYAGYSEPPIMSGGFGVAVLPGVQDLTSQLLAENRARQDSEELRRQPFAPRPEFEWAGEKVEVSVGDGETVEVSAGEPAAPAPSLPTAAPPAPPPPLPARPPAFGPAAPPVAAPWGAPRRSPLNPVIRSIGAAVGYLLDRVVPKFAAGAAPVAYEIRPDPPREAFARVECPPVVVGGQEFELTVGIAPKQTEGVIGDVLKRPPSSIGPYDLSIQVIVEGFSIRADETWRVSLPVTADDPYPAAVMHLTAAPPGAPVLQRTIQVLYSIGGQTIGAAFRPLVVVSDARLVATTPSPPPPLGVDIGVPTAKTACDLTVRISTTESPNLLQFTIESPPPGLATSPDPIRMDIGDNPQTFARQLVDKVNSIEGQPGSYNLLLGFGRTVADKLPPEFWDALRQAAARVKDRPVTLLLLSQEPYIPWELAVMEPPLIDEKAPPFLAAQVSVGRWVIGPRVKVPPPAEVNVDQAAVIWGVYSLPGWQRLREAEDEANQIQKDYGAVSVEAKIVDVLACFHGTPLADLLHFAVHGIYDPSGVQDGLVLTDGQALDPMEVRGSPLAGAPFVFLNACQVGSGNRILGDYAGMAAAFLYAGASGVVAPLWSIKDSVAKQIAVDFYAKTKAGSRPADVFRTERGAFTAGAGNSPTYLAYQFFGHPKMELLWRKK